MDWIKEFLKKLAKEAGKAFIAEKGKEFLTGGRRKDELPPNHMEKLKEIEYEIKSMEIRLEELEQSLKTTRLIAIISLGLAILIGILFLLLRI